ncbi:GNAT family N-acetyltransferase [Gilvibacter sp.]|uniref:GNAT family N-acetyltransferase n=1 Tax=Gilvibacter sp. TaxID=2729997 RepID=UPI003F4A7C02
MKVILQTERTYLREFLPSDAEFFYSLNLDPEVIRYTGDAPFANIAEAEAFIEAYDQYRVNGYGRWAVCSKDDDSFMGFCGLKYHPDEDLTEVGFRFYRELWNQGFATETAKACIKLGFEEFNLAAIYAHADRENHGSIRVLEKCGLSFVKPIEYDGHMANLYRLLKEDYDAN